MAESGRKALASKENKSCTGSRTVAALAGGSKGAMHYRKDEIVAIGGAQADKG